MHKLAPTINTCVPLACCDKSCDASLSKNTTTLSLLVQFVHFIVFLKYFFSVVEQLTALLCIDLQILRWIERIVGVQIHPMNCSSLSHVLIFLTCTCHSPVFMKISISPTKPDSDSWCNMFQRSLPINVDFRKIFGCEFPLESNLLVLFNKYLDDKWFALKFSKNYFRKFEREKMKYHVVFICPTFLRRCSKIGFYSTHFHLEIKVNIEMEPSRYRFCLYPAPKIFKLKLKLGRPNQTTATLRLLLLCAHHLTLVTWQQPSLSFSSSASASSKSFTVCQLSN